MNIKVDVQDFIDTEQNPKLQPLTDSQSGIWFAQCRDPDNPIYKTGEYIVIDGQLDCDVLAKAIEITINEVDSLHAQFVTTTEGPRMYVQRKPWQVLRLDYSKRNKAMDEAISWMKGQLREPVNLETGPLFGMSLLKMSELKHIWFFSLHHIAIDGYSMSLIASRVATIYNKLMNNQLIDDIQLVSQDALLAEDDNYKASGKYEKDRQFYLNRYEDHNDTINLAGKPTVTSDFFWRKKGKMESEVKEDMSQLASFCRVHWYSVMISAMASYVHRMTRSKDVVLGVPLMGRLGSVAIQTPAMRVNILPVRVSFEDGMSIKELIKSVNKEFANVRRHQGYRYEELHRELNLVKDNRNLFGPLVNIMPFQYDYDFNGSEAKAYNLSAGPVDDMSFYCYEQDSFLNIDIDANPALYSEVELAQHQRRMFSFMAEFFKHGCNENSEAATISELPLLIDDEKERLIHTWNNTEHKLQSETLASLLQKQIISSSDATALIFEEQSYSFNELAKKVNACAHWLIAQGMQKGDRIAVMLPRSVELIIVQQATIKCGAIYVPIDPDYPEARIAYILQSAKAKFVFSNSAVCQALPEQTSSILVDDPKLKQQWQKQATTEPNSLVKLNDEDPAYIIYTSGSTDKPKGVVISHKAVVNRLLWMQDSYTIDSSDRVLQKTPAGFDVSIWEFFWPMITGATLVLAKPEGHKDPNYLAELIAKEKITTMHFVPSMLQVFVQQAKAELCTSLRQVFCSGEALPVELVNDYYQNFKARLHNLYGPTEAAIDVTYWPCQANEDHLSVPIGFPVWNTQIYILDEKLQPVPPGVVGDLYIAGDQLALGYFEQEELTKERFINNPFAESDDARMYLSGDLARWREDGAIEYCGRSDFQVKIRGFRIELEEIEHALAQIPEVLQVAVLAQEYSAGDKRLVAYVNHEQGEEMDVLALQKIIADKLPEYMVPGYFVHIDEFPLTPNGKLDRKALPKPDLSGQVGSTGPTNLVEERLCKLFCQLLEIPNVGTEDNFFELGGHSLLAAQLIAYVKEIMGIELSLAAVFEAPTVKGIAAKLAGTNDDQALNVLLPLRKREQQPALFCVHPAGGLSWCYAALTPVIPSYIPLYGVQSKNLAQTDEPLPEHMMDMAADYVKALREEQAFGPYHLMGWSIGGMIAHAMAAVLQQQGQEVGLLVLLDSYPTEQWQTMNPPGEHQALGALIRMAGVEFDEEAHSSLNRQEVVDILQDAGSSMAHLKAETISAMIEVVINNNSRVRDKVDYVYQGDMLFFNALKPESEAFLDRNGWNNYMDGNINVIEIDCIHRDMMRPDKLKFIGEHVAEALEAFNNA
ncbi:amino acid adenylation domain-containing protein [Agaribacterium sp. ZY112]|uniref:amino acid adenylation domain-containing protein n=1 Tax=Agaribacterium sp. ZY112 TaxID=3233574 RepID=UPI00352532FA